MINGADRDRPYTTGIGDMIHYGRYIGIIAFGEYDNHQNSFHIGFYVNWINDKTESLRQDLGYWIRRRDVKHEQSNPHGSLGTRPGRQDDAKWEIRGADDAGG